uniref:Uncharacterized protein n=1 Tax=Rhizophora mucronata TaxID=61149 RepID=A0A2P2IM70_RHIMU
MLKYWEKDWIDVLFESNFFWRVSHWRSLANVSLSSRYDFVVPIIDVSL